MSADRKLFHKRRRTGIGGSDLGAILGVSPYATPLDVYLSKMGEPELDAPSAEQSEAMRIGQVIEPTLAALFSERTGLKTRKGTFARSRQHAFAIGHPDALVIDAGKPIAGAEWKNVGLQNAGQWGESGTDIVPPVYLLQCVHYMLVTELPEWWLGALIGGNEFRVYRVKRDAELEAMALDAERAFWQCVEAKTPPEQPRTSEQALMLFPQATVPKIEANGEALRALAALRQCKEIETAAKLKLDEHKTTLMRYMGDAQQLVDLGGNVLVDWGNRESKRIDVQALRIAHPEIAARFERTSKTRAFLVKGEKP
jgi:putative phage-type endonuclease